MTITTITKQRLMPEPSPMSKLLLLIFTLLSVVVLMYPFIYPPQKSITLPATPKPVPNFSQYRNVIEKKRAFFDYLAPVVQQQNQHIEQQRTQVKAIAKHIKQGKVLTLKQHRQLAKLNRQYQVNENLAISQQLKVLLNRVDIVPLPLALIQAANESAWGTSRFARKGYNFFGQWCYKKDCGFVPKKRNPGATHEVKKFDSVSAAVAAYLNNLNTHKAYQSMRSLRQQQREKGQTVNAKALLYKLTHYSERGEAYVEELLSMLTTNLKYMPIHNN